MTNDMNNDEDNSESENVYGYGSKHTRPFLNPVPEIQSIPSLF